MENSQNLNKEKTPKKSKTNYQSLEEQITKIKLGFEHAKETSILAELSKVGYTQEKIEGFISKIAQVEQLSQAQKKEYGAQYAETEKFNKKKDEIDAVFSRHLALCRILFKNDHQAEVILGLKESRKRAFGDWFQKVSNFYAQIESSSVYKEKVKEISLQEAEVKQQQTALTELMKIKETQKKEIALAQKATEQRDKAFDEVYQKYTELVAYVKVLFQNDQILEAFGIVTKR